MKLFRDITIAICIGVVWAIVVVELVGWLAASSGGRPSEVDALARGDLPLSFVVALLKDAATYLVPSLMAAYAIERMTDRPLVFALVAGVPAFAYDVYTFGSVMSQGGLDGSRGVYVALNAVLVLLAIAGCVALLGFLPRRAPDPA